MTASTTLAPGRRRPATTASVSIRAIWLTRSWLAIAGRPTGFEARRIFVYVIDPSCLCEFVDCRHFYVATHCTVMTEFAPPALEPTYWRRPSPKCPQRGPLRTGRS